ncbi:MAG TPA: DNA-binding domain-containing protein [Kofleriaceae bacterium]|nr:DNA-binding domain-containing protein [Kofleriaceae bacterium]
MAETPDLATLQRQFSDRVTTGAPVEGLTANGDLEVYADMYAVRLHDALVDDYPKLKVALGEDRLRALASSYLRAHPPTSFTLRDLGIEFPAHLRQHPDAPAWAADLAALERARMDVFDGPDAEPLERDAVIALGESLPELGLTWVPSSQVVAIGWNVDDLWSAIEDEQDVFEPEPVERVVLVWRHETSVLHRTLEADEAMIAAHVARGLPFSELCGHLAEIHGVDEATPRAAQMLLYWLENATLVEWQR